MAGRAGLASSETQLRYHPAPCWLLQEACKGWCWQSAEFAHMHKQDMQATRFTAGKAQRAVAVPGRILCGTYQHLRDDMCVHAAADRS
jgi:hypothetical protein